MKSAFVVIARDKAHWVRKLADSVLAQTHHPLEIIFSDQGSTDGTRQILEEAARSYNGPNTVRVLDCPHTGERGMLGINAHLDWVHSQTDADVIHLTSADDLALPERASKVMAAYEEHHPDMVLTNQWFCGPDLKEGAQSIWPRETRWVTAHDCVVELAGGSSSQSYTHEFADAVGPLAGHVCGQDVVMPLLATMRKGAYYLREPLHHYIHHADASNTGLEGQMLAADAKKKLQLEEIAHYQGAANFYFCIGMMEKWGIVGHPATNIIAHGILDRTASWQNCRNKMTLARIPPLAMAA